MDAGGRPCLEVNSNRSGRRLSSVCDCSPRLNRCLSPAKVSMRAGSTDSSRSYCDLPTATSFGFEATSLRRKARPVTVLPCRTDCCASPSGGASDASSSKATAGCTKRRRARTRQRGRTLPLALASSTRLEGGKRTASVAGLPCGVNADDLAMLIDHGRPEHLLVVTPHKEWASRSGRRRLTTLLVISSGDGLSTEECWQRP